MRSKFEDCVSRRKDKADGLIYSQRRNTKEMADWTSDQQGWTGGKASCKGKRRTQAVNINSPCPGVGDY